MEPQLRWLTITKISEGYPLVKRVSHSMQLNSLRSQHAATLAALEKYRLLVESVQDYAIFILDPAGYIQTWNRGAEKINGYAPHEIIGKHFSVFYRPEDVRARKPQRELELARAHGRVEDEDWRIRKDGSQFWSNVVITPLYDSEHGLVGYAKVTRDLTERKRHEETLRKANELLRHQQLELERLNKSKDEFISLASHQLRTPATATKLLLGMLMEGYRGDLDESQGQLVKKAYESNERQVALINGLLQVAQIDSGRVALHETDTNITQLMQNIINDQMDTAKKRMQRLHFQAAPAPVQADVDADYFRMAIENLIDNALKYTPEYGEVEVALSAAADHFTVTVKDSGVGIAEADLGKLFEKFKRIPNKLSKAVGGTGLGLYWTQRVIALHGGTISVSSTIDVGTTFTVLMPCGVGHA